MVAEGQHKETVNKVKSNDQDKIDFQEVEESETKRKSHSTPKTNKSDSSSDTKVDKVNMRNNKQEISTSIGGLTPIVLREK